MKRYLEDIEYCEETVELARFAKALGHPTIKITGESGLLLYRRSGRRISIGTINHLSASERIERGRIDTGRSNSSEDQILYS